MEITTVQQMKNLDKQAISDFAIKDEILMENAGLAAVKVIDQEFGITGKRFLILCGSGNNGGDGLVVARKIHSMRGQSVIITLGDTSKYRGAALTNYHIVNKIALEQKEFSQGVLKKELEKCDAVVDAIFGTGLIRPVTGIFKNAINLVNSKKKPVFSLDIPSGINGNSGMVMGNAVHANYTITFGLPKIGNLFYPGFKHNGKLFVSHISFPQSLTHKINPLLETNTPAELPARKADGHKGEFGTALFVAGAASYYGAPLFAAMSFLKTGGGYARLAAPASMIPRIASKGSEIVFHPQQETTPGGSIAWENRQQLLDLSQQCDLVVIGPGLSLVEETQQLVLFLIEKVKKPILLDGDGITALAGKTERLEKRNHETILTPHLGEMASLTSLTVEKLKNEIVQLLPSLCEKLKATIVVKGAHSLIGSNTGNLSLNLSGNSGMATAGSGDVLTGTIAAMYCLGLPFTSAVKTGVFLHGFAGDLAAEEIGEDGVTARDILGYLPSAVKLYRQKYSEIRGSHYNRIHLVT